MLLQCLPTWSFNRSSSVYTMFAHFLLCFDLMFAQISLVDLEFCVNISFPHNYICQKTRLEDQAWRWDTYRPWFPSFLGFRGSSLWDSDFFPHQPVPNMSYIEWKMYLFNLTVTNVFPVHFLCVQLCTPGVVIWFVLQCKLLDAN